MAITTLDGLFAGLRPTQEFNKVITPTLVVGRPASLWALGGNPAAGSFDATLNGVVLSSSSTIPNGAIPHFDPSSGNSYLAYLGAQSSAAGGSLLLLDRLWHNGGITATSTSAQNITSPTWPSRNPTSGIDDTPTTTGVGVLLAVEISAVMGAAVPTITISYTNSAGTSGRTATNILAVTSASPAGCTYWIGLQAGDLGVRSVQSVTLSVSWVSGTMNLVAYRRIASLPLLAGIPNAIDSLTGAGQRLYNGVVPWMVFVPGATTATLIQSGTYIESQG